MVTRSSIVIVVALFLCVIGLAGVASADAQDDEPLVEPCAETPPDDFADPEAENEDVIGWVDGYWYSEPLEINASGGITQEELAALSARSAARFEALRCLPMDEIPPVEIVTRDEFANETASFYEELDEETRLFDNAQFATLLTIGQDEDSLEVRRDVRAAAVGGYYNFEENRIVVVSDDPDSLSIDESVLAHELGHAIQDQHFNLSRYERDTHDRDKGALGLIEGDVHRIEQRYLEYCEDERWSEPCVIDEGREMAGDEAPPNWALYLMEFQPYSDGPTFAQHLYERGGRDALNAAYDEIPQTAHHVIYPASYGEFEPEAVEIENASDDAWERLEIAETPGYQVIGQSGLSAIFIGVTYESGGMVNVVDPTAILNTDERGEIDESNPLNYDHPETDGWRGDRLVVFRNAENETATVWTLAWDDDEDTRAFVDAYEQLIAFRGGEPVEGEEGIYTFGEESDFDMALAVYPDGDRLTIVTAPTVDALDEVHQAPEPDDDSSDREEPSDDEWIGLEELPGFGVVAALVALVVTGLAFRR